MEGARCFTLMGPLSRFSDPWTSTRCAIFADKFAGFGVDAQKLPVLEPGWGHRDRRAALDGERGAHVEMADQRADCAAFFGAPAERFQGGLRQNSGFIARVRGAHRFFEPLGEALADRSRQLFERPGGRAASRERPPARVPEIARVGAVSMRDPGRFSAKNDELWFANDFVEGAAELDLGEVVAISDHEADLAAGVSKLFEEPEDLRLKRRVKLRRSEPGAEEIAQDDELDALFFCASEERDEVLVGGGIGATVHIGQDPRGHRADVPGFGATVTALCLTARRTKTLDARVGRVIRLSEDVANQIAAGEVVERPASVVKELLENAVDAGAERIHVEIAGGGIELISVTDDGVGMEREDAVTSLERHATSKIRTSHDIQHVSTLGFRGEALPSIASVSRFTLNTSPRGALEGTRINVEGGRVLDVAASPPAAGTRVEVKDLFFNVPARRKFLKREQTELSHISDAVFRLILARPEISVRLVSDGRLVFDIPKQSGNDAKVRLSRVFGSKIAERLFEIPKNAEALAEISVSGFVGAPDLNERTTKNLLIFVNGRFVRDRTIQHAVQDAYRTLLERGRYPVAVLSVHVPPEMVDVNVHPQKTEVRFTDASAVFRAVRQAVLSGLKDQPWVAEFGMGAATSWPAQSLIRSAPYADLLRPLEGDPHPFGHASVTYDRALDGYEPREASSMFREDRAARFSTLEPIGQVLSTYLVCQGPDRMVLIDQHAAHERVAFERLRCEYKKGTVEVQPLLFPHTFELDPARGEVADLARERLAQLGFELERFGGDTWILKTAPTALGSLKIETLIENVLDELRELELADTPIEEAMDAVMSCAACHTVVRAGDRLSKEEIRALLLQMDEIDFGAHCPHGRPVYREWTAPELAKMFHRT